MNTHVMHMPVELEPQHVHAAEGIEEVEELNDTGEEADIDTDDLDAGTESTFVDEFDDDDDTMGGGVLTPTPTIAA